MLLQIFLLGLSMFYSIIDAQSEEYDYESSTPYPQPYSFAFTAGRYPGNVDRTRAEYGDTSGVVRGLYTYVDPRQQIRAVEYTADKEGFHPSFNIPAAEDTPAVVAARSRHFKLYNKIAKNRNHYEPADTEAVAKAKANHLALYDHIAQLHARLAAEHEAAKLKQQTDSEEKYR